MRDYQVNILTPNGYEPIFVSAESKMDAECLARRVARDENWEIQSIEVKLLDD